MMTKDKAGNYVFVAGKKYRMLENINPVWPKDRASECLEVQSGLTLEGEEPVIGARGLFTNGDDTRWWNASAQFEVAN